MTILELHHWFAKKNNVVWFHEISLISRGQFNSFRSIQICDSINSDGATFALNHATSSSVNRNCKQILIFEETKKLQKQLFKTS